MTDAENKDPFAHLSNGLVELKNAFELGLQLCARLAGRLPPNLSRRLRAIWSRGLRG